MKNPYRIDGPAVISFSGGRSSGFMLYNILEAYDGKLPDDIQVVFSNTGLEHRETYEFIHRIEENWTPITWLEYTLNEIGKLEAIAREEPEQLDWWIDTEEKHEHTFRKDRPNYASIKRHDHLQQAFDFGDTIDCFCTD